MVSDKEILRAQIQALAKAGIGTNAICKQLKCSRTLVSRWKNKEEYKDKQRPGRPRIITEKICHYCGKKFPRRGHLNRHLKFHENKREFKCTYEGCDKAFNTKHCLTKHQLVHSETKLFKCDYCPLETNRQENLKDHIKSKHTREGLFQCKWPDCGKAFTRRNLRIYTLKTHGRTKINSRVKVNGKDK